MRESRELAECKVCEKQIIATRDKWWIERIEAIAKTEFHYGEQIGYRIKYDKWQQLKLSLQSSVALTNLMGKFPDLPDVREVGQ